jgi:hypothetical protein
MVSKPTRQQQRCQCMSQQRLGQMVQRDVANEQAQQSLIPQLHRSVNVGHGGRAYQGQKSLLFSLFSSKTNVLTTHSN